MHDSSPGRLVIISGPSGAGKSTIVGRLLRECPLPLQLSVSATTRSSRPGEQQGRDYHFLSEGEFSARRKNGAFLECKEVFGRGVWYGTLREEVDRGLTDGRWVILEIDVEGARAVMQSAYDPITIFIHPGGMQELERRLRSRGTEHEEAILRRLEVAEQEMAVKSTYKHEVVNREIEQAVSDTCRILESYDV